MKTHTTLLNTIPPMVILMLALSGNDTRGETLVVGTNQPVNFSLTVPSNHAVVIYGGRFVAKDPEVYWRVTQSGALHLLRSDSMSDPILTTPAGHPNILAGPLLLELFIAKTSDFDGSWMSYEILPLAGLKTLIVPGMATNSVAVASGTNFRLLSRSSRDVTMGPSFQLISGSAAAYLGMEALNSLLDMEFSGPIDIQIGNNMMDARWFTYSLHSGSVGMLPGGVIAAAGVNGLCVEESSDLVNWSGAAVILKDASPKKFYRFKASK